MQCADISNINLFTDLFVYPTTCNYYFYLSILLGLMIILAWSLFKSEEKKTGKGEMISSMAISSIVTTLITLAGTLVTGSTDLPMIPNGVLLIILAITIPSVLIWIFKD